MIKKVLVANRGEIAVRIIRACRELGIETVAVFSQADRDALHVQLADEAYCIGPTASKDSYLNFTNIMSVATLTGCDAIHPGYGFLAENEAFAELCRECNVTFIGPSPEAIAKMGIKDIARETMREAGVPIVPGVATGVIESLDEARAIAEEIGYPVIIKATAGGGRERNPRRPATKASSSKASTSPSRKRRRRLATQASILKNILKISAMSKFKCSLIRTAIRFISGSATARSSAGCKNWSRKRRRRRLTTRCAGRWARRRSRRRKRSTTPAPVRLNLFMTTGTNNFTSWR